ncbi:hypothetical protein CEUSTIGMA_g7037.t1 [Chlamydomonas eustigma]|uniref:Pseudouridine synthase I TruA alpha/beta domain-containing protein n=1 Tax=Chlamydomonas eustigma TaxID=1157962 RepID=A0A250X951_9CHLO|nr:hypothetical protein CEUSTIGMA_g7037.t1 [Chlamydomonas eustigma]|eukprot:GAX79596.1 hypothetical protein CEUSTIGMA_g7037.t1 [Chlamydomonas eustigma]
MNIENASSAAEDKSLSKRTVALHVAYVGTSYKGSSVNRTLGEDATVEQVLERAIFKAGLILESNFGSFSKVKWARASRTDKGVHSLGTVMSMRLLVHDNRYSPEGDPEGLTHADLINAHLPPTIRVFTVQKTNKKFNARHLALSRIYEYYLPVSMLELKMDGSEHDVERIATFRRILRLFLGSHPFHNFTKMKQHDKSGNLAKTFNKTRKEAAAEARAKGVDPRLPVEEIKALMAKKMLAQGHINGSGAGVAGGGEQVLVGSGAGVAGGGEQVLAGSGAGTADAVEQVLTAQADSATNVAYGGPLTEGSLSAEVRNDTTVSAAGMPALDGSGNCPDHGYKDSEGLAVDAVQGEARGQNTHSDLTAEPSGHDEVNRGVKRRREQRGRKNEDEDEDEGGEGGDEDEEGELDDEEGGEEGASREAAGESGCVNSESHLEWTEDKGRKGPNRVTQTFYRKIFSFDASEPEPLVEGGMSCMRLTVHGQSFMLHHIRHMIGTAIAVTLGILPEELLVASMLPPARVTLPRAPPHTLLLSDCRFHRFPPISGTDNGLLDITGPELSLRTGGQQRKETFRKEVLQPALQHLVELPEWQLWLRSLRQCASFPNERLEPFLEKYEAWKSAFDEKRKARASEAAGLSLTEAAFDGEDVNGSRALDGHTDPTDLTETQECSRSSKRWEKSKGRGGGNSQRKSSWWNKKKGT